jgi:hypothetical protein
MSDYDDDSFDYGEDNSFDEEELSQVSTVSNHNQSLNQDRSSSPNDQ